MNKLEEMPLAIVTAVKSAWRGIYAYVFSRERLRTPVGRGPSPGIGSYQRFQRFQRQ